MKKAKKSVFQVLAILIFREHMLSLKGTLQQVNKTSQSPAKKQKVDLYYNNFFEALNSTEPQVCFLFLLFYFKTCL